MEWNGFTPFHSRSVLYCYNLKSAAIMAHALPTPNAGQCAAVPASIAMLSDESNEDSFYVHPSAGCTTSSSLLEELVCPPCPITCKVASSANIPIRNQLNSNDLEYHKKYPNIMDHSYVGVCVENHTPPTKGQ